MNVTIICYRGVFSSSVESLDHLFVCCHVAALFNHLQTEDQRFSVLYCFSF